MPKLSGHTCNLTHWAIIILAICCLVLLASLAASNACAKEYTFTWSANTEPLDGYRLYYKKGGDASQLFNGSNVIDIGRQTYFTISGLEENTTYHFALTAYRGAEESNPTEVITVYPPPGGTTSTSAGSHAFTFSWQPDPTFSIAAYRFYLNGNPICESTEPSKGSLTCMVTPLRGLMEFTMTIVNTDGLESAPANILQFDPRLYPEIFKWREATLYWNFADSSILTGIQVRHNSSTLCTTDATGANSITCEFLLSPQNNVFIVDGYNALGDLIVSTNALEYSPPETVEDPNLEDLSASFSVLPDSGVAPLTARFDGTPSTGAIVTYQWDFGDGDSTSGAIAEHLYNAAGSYTTTLTVTDGNGSTEQAFSVVSISQPPEPPSPEPPQAIIASSAGIGDAPLSVTFDGSLSSTNPPPISSYTWEFGDGVTATGATTTHTYAIPGLFQASLSVMDSSGLTSSSTTPVIVNTPAQTNNVPPTPSFTAQPLTGNSPLTVAFDASASSDPDGTIETFVWSFGDGTKGMGKNATHSYTEVADYTVALTTTDDKADSASTSKIITVNAPDAATFYFEMWEIKLDSNWTTVKFERPFNTPVVIAGPASSLDQDPTTIRIRNLTPQGFEVRLQEWEYQDGTHPTETLAFLALEQGSYILDNGNRIEAGQFTGTGAFVTVALKERFATQPIVLTQVVTTNKEEAVTGRIRNIGTDSFEFALQEQESSKTAHTAETTCYLAIEPGSGMIENYPFEAGVTAKVVKHNWYNLIYQHPFNAPPLVLARMQTTDGSDTALVKMRNLRATGVELKVEEEQSKDSETNHTTEVVGYLAVNPAAQNNQYDITLTWEYETNARPQPAGFRFYQNELLLCETSNPDARTITCTTVMQGTTSSFTFRAFFADGSDSTSSNAIEH